ncbi:MAG: hypothetical protein ACLFTG_06780, partial [Alphaproteobacteria bacterium]
ETAAQEVPAGNGAKPKRKRARKKAPASGEAAEAGPPEAAAGDERAAEGEAGEQAEAAERRPPRQRAPKPASGERVVGLGDHVPSFLLRPVPVRPANSDKGD